MDNTDDCWLVRGAGRDGYVVTTEADGERLAHRIAWKTYNQRPIPEGYAIHHKCGARSCVNPHHLQALTPQEHAAIHHPPTDLAQPPAGQCRHGHDWSMWGKVNAQGRWVCAECGRAADLRYVARKRRPRVVVA
jgi:hypothetical protein